MPAPTQKFGFFQLLTAAYTRLTTHALTSSYAFFNKKAPKSQAKPYHRIQHPYRRKSVGFSTRDTAAEDIVFEIHSWFDETSGKGEKACSEAQDNIVQALTSSALTITDYHEPARLDVDYINILDDPEEPSREVKHGIMRIRVEMAPSS